MRLQGSTRQCLDAIRGGYVDRFQILGFGYLEACAIGSASGQIGPHRLVGPGMILMYIGGRDPRAIHS
ncbi:MAG: hypothetical protein P8L34_04795 [Arenicellales bacterium]|nr:hypothetical protein [Arenicellales bacterium]